MNIEIFDALDDRIPYWVRRQRILAQGDQAERAGGLANVRADSTAQKLKDEQKAARGRPN